MKKPIMNLMLMLIFVMTHFSSVSPVAAQVASVSNIASVAQVFTPAAPTTPGNQGNAGGNQDDTCTSDLRQNTDNRSGLLTQVIDYFKEVVNEATRKLYEGVISHQAFLNAVNAAFILFIVFFGIAFMFGIVPFTLGQAVTRLFKMAIILALINQGFTFFHDYAIRFFNHGTDELIDQVIGIAIGDSSATSVNASGAPQPFRKMEGVVEDAISPEMMVSTLTAFTTGPMGPAMGGLMAIGMVAFIQAIVRALRVYCISLVAKALLFGLAPIFITFVLFERTKNIFTGWVNQLVTYSLQPLMMFAFISFFIVLINSAIDNILGVEICWTSFDQMSGATTQTQFWRFVDENGNPSESPFTWNGMVTCIENAGEDGKCPDFPVSIIDILTFLILSHLAYRFSDVVVNIATEIASSTLFLDKLRSGMAELVQRTESGAGGVNQGRRQ